MFVQSTLSKKRDSNIPFAYWAVDRFGIPESVIDFGCGPGVILNTLLRITPDSKNVHACAIDYFAEARQYLDPRIHFAKLDLSYYGEQDPLPNEFLQPFEWIICTEVAEHLPKNVAYNFICMLVAVVKNGGTIFFSAAQPGDKGTGHVNEQPKQYWIDIWNQFGFKNQKHDFEEYYLKARPKQKIDRLTGKRLPGYARNLLVLRKN
jgi:SAM-dependent methyltransferase